jgi:hypothetical protein
MNFVSPLMNHFKAVKTWSDAFNGEAKLDVTSFKLEIRARNRFFLLHPQFIANLNGRLGYVPTLSPDSGGFVGWLPYQPISWPLSGDKLIFKTKVKSAGFTTPDFWMKSDLPTEDFVMKNSVGSFGYQLNGPFRNAELPPDVGASAVPINRSGVNFAE